LDELSLSLIEGAAENSVTDWSCNEEGKLVLFAAHVDAESDSATSLATAMQTAFCALRNRIDDPAEMVKSIAETIGRLQPGEVFGSIGCAFVDCDTLLIQSSTIESGQCQIALDAIEQPEIQNTSLLETESATLSIDNGSCGWRMNRR
jgi:hypothetical protein